MKTIAIYGLGKTGEAIYNQLRKDYRIIKIDKNTLFKKRKLSRAEIIIFCAGNLSRLLGKEFKNTYEIRLEETKLNKKIADSFAKKVSSLRTPIIVVSNHSDMLEKYFRFKLKRKNVYSFGKSLDSVRISNYLGKKVEVIGFHGLVIPLIKKNNKGAYLKIMQEVDKKVLDSCISKRLDYDFIARVFAEDLKKFPWKEKKPKLNRIEKELLKNIKKKFEKDYKRIFPQRG